MVHNKKYLIVLFVIIISVVGFFVFNILQKNIPKSPKLSISEVEWDFGKIKENERSEHIFTLTNDGGEELVISRVRASCGCTATMLSSDRIPPGKSAELKTTFNPSGFEGRTKKSIYIETNDPELPRAKIEVLADVETIPAPKAYISNSQWDFGLISQGDSPEFAFTIENRGEIELIIEKIDASEYIQNNVTMPLIISPSEKKDIIFVYNSNEHEIGEVKESIRIFCNDTRKKAFSLRISGYIKEKNEPMISVFPTEATFDLTGNPNDKLVQQFTLRNLGGKLIKIISVSTSADYIVPLESEFELKPKEDEKLQLSLVKEKIQEKDLAEKKVNYLYLTLAIPIDISK